MENRRDLPWRNTKDPYKIWLSEVILQQTRVDQGTDYYLKFIHYYPKVELLANAAEDEVLRLWQGLGYYSRARNLHATAKIIAENYRGIFPKNYSEVVALKGVGEYTAAAICSFAYQLPYPVIDGNVYRLLSRYLNCHLPIDSAEGKKTFQKVALELLDKKNPEVYNQAIMEMGALVCTPRQPSCSSCVLASSCAARSSGTVEQLPVKTKKTKVRNRYFHYLIIRNEGAILIKKRSEKDVWEGLYNFPLIETSSSKRPSREKLARWNVQTMKNDGAFKHLLSHQRIHAQFWLAEVSQFESLSLQFTSVDLGELKRYPLPQLLVKYLNASAHFEID